MRSPWFSHRGDPRGTSVIREALTALALTASLEDRLRDAIQDVLPPPSAAVQVMGRWTPRIRAERLLSRGGGADKQGARGRAVRAEEHREARAEVGVRNLRATFNTAMRDGSAWEPRVGFEA